MKGFSKKILASLLLVGCVPLIVNYLLSGYLTGAFLTGTATFLVLVGVVVAAFQARKNLVDPLSSSMELFDCLIEGREASSQSENHSEVPELRRVRKALHLLVTEQAEAGNQLREMVTSLAASKKELMESNGFLNAVFESGEMGILVTDMEGNYLESNQNLFQLLALDASEGCNKASFCAAFEDDEEVLESWQSVISNPAEKIDIEVVTKDAASPRSIHLFSDPVRDGDDEIFARMWILRDDSERIKLQEELQQSQKMEAMGRLAGGIAHDFNNLLTAIRGNLELAMGDPAVKRDEMLKDQVDEAYDAAKSATSLVQQILGYSRKNKLTLEAVSLNGLVTSTAKLVNRMLNGAIELNTELTDSSVVANADQTQIQQILINLCVNSRDALPQEGVPVQRESTKVAG